MQEGKEPSKEEPGWHLWRDRLKVMRDAGFIPTMDAADDIEVWIDPGNANADDLQELYDALSELHRACGGAGVVFRDEKTEVFANAEVPA